MLVRVSVVDCLQLFVGSVVVQHVFHAPHHFDTLFFVFSSEAAGPSCSKPNSTCDSVFSMNLAGPGCSMQIHYTALMLK